MCDQINFYKTYATCNWNKYSVFNSVQYTQDMSFMIIFAKNENLYHARSTVFSLNEDFVQNFDSKKNFTSNGVLFEYDFETGSYIVNCEIMDVCYWDHQKVFHDSRAFSRL